MFATAAPPSGIPPEQVRNTSHIGHVLAKCWQAWLEVVKNGPCFGRTRAELADGWPTGAGKSHFEVGRWVANFGPSWPHAAGRRVENIPGSHSQGISEQIRSVWTEMAECRRERNCLWQVRSESPPPWPPSLGVAQKIRPAEFVP